MSNMHDTIVQTLTWVKYRAYLWDIIKQSRMMPWALLDWWTKMTQLGKWNGIENQNMKTAMIFLLLVWIGNVSTVLYMYNFYMRDLVLNLVYYHIYHYGFLFLHDVFLLDTHKNCLLGSYSLQIHLNRSLILTYLISFRCWFMFCMFLIGRLVHWSILWDRQWGKRWTKWSLYLMHCLVMCSMDSVKCWQRCVSDGTSGL